MIDEGIKSAAAVIRKLREDKGLSQVQLARMAEMTPAQLCKLEHGRNAMTEATIRRISDALGIRISELLGECRQDCAEKKPSQRKVKSNGDDYVLVLREDDSEDEIAFYRDFIRRSEDKITDSETRLGIVPGTSVQLIFPYGVDEASAELLARDMRFSLGIGSMPIQDLATILEMRGIRIFNIKRQKTFDSIAFFNTRLHTLSIVINGNNTDERNTYRLAYELGATAAFAMSSFKTIRDDGCVHRLLRRFTAAFLMPEETVRMDVAQCGIAPGMWSMKLLNLLKRRFSVSAEAYALRLENLGLIHPSLRICLRDQLRQHYEKNPDDMEPHEDIAPGEETRTAILQEAGNCAMQAEGRQ